MSIFTKHSKKKSAALLLAAALLITAAVGGTLAYLSATTDAITNTFTPAEVTCDIIENFNDDGDKTDVTVKNTGDVYAFIRAAVIANTVDEAGHVTGNFDLTPYLAGSTWTQGDDGYYYYNVSVAPGGSTTDLLKDGASMPLTGRSVTILAEAIQADGLGTTTASDAFDNAAASGSTGGGN